MTKQAFLDALRDALSGLPQEDIDERIRFYGEMIDDRVDDGMSQADAVAAIGDIEKIVAEIIADTPFVKLVKEKMKPNRRIRAWEVVLLVLGSPIWLALLISAFAVVLSVYIALWAVIISLWAAFVAVVGSAFGGVVGGILFAVTQNVYSGMALCFVGVACVGIAILMFYGCKAVTKGFALLTKKTVLAVKTTCVGKETAS